MYVENQNLDICIGYATISWCEYARAWALPGRGFTNDREEAVKAAKQIHSLISGSSLFEVWKKTA